MNRASRMWALWMLAGCMLVLPLIGICGPGAVPWGGAQRLLGAEPPASRVSAAAADEADAEMADVEMSVWMEKKLQYSQALLRAMAQADYDQLRLNARRLRLLNRVEGFVRRRNPDYRANVMIFSRVAAEIERQAKRRNLEGVALAFNQLTVSCVECHKSLRQKPGSGPAATPALPPARSQAGGGENGAGEAGAGEAGAEDGSS